MTQYRLAGRALRSWMYRLGIGPVQAATCSSGLIPGSSACSFTSLTASSTGLGVRPLTATRSWTVMAQIGVERWSMNLLDVLSCCGSQVIYLQTDLGLYYRFRYKVVQLCDTESCLLDRPRGNAVQPSHTGPYLGRESTRFLERRKNSCWYALACTWSLKWRFGAPRPIVGLVHVDERVINYKDNKMITPEVATKIFNNGKY